MGYNSNTFRIATGSTRTKVIMSKIIVTTTESVLVRKIAEVLRVIKGSTMWARNIGRHSWAGLKGSIGGEVKTYTDMTPSARDEAYNRTINETTDLDADAVVGVRFATSMVMGGTPELLAYGTTIKLQ